MSVFQEREVKMQTEGLITVSELAKKLNVPISWIYQRTRLGQKAIPHVKMGKYVRFNLDEVVVFFRNKAPADSR
jgi:excisionase family DNA binding protein